MKNFFTYGKSKECASRWNEKNSKKRWFSLPLGIRGFVSILWWDPKISTSKEYIHSLLTWKKIDTIKKYKLNTISATLLRDLWNQKVINKKTISSLKWWDFSDNWNQQFSITYNCSMPKTLQWLISTLGGNKSEGSTQALITSLFENNEVKIETVPLSTQEQLMTLWNSWVFTEKDISPSKWKALSDKWNKLESKNQWFTLPLSIPTLINCLWWSIKVSQKKEYVISLLKSEKWNTVPWRNATKWDINGLWKSGQITEINLWATNYAKFAKEYNQGKSWIRLPKTIYGLITLLWWTPWTWMSKAYVKNLLEGK